MKERMQGMAMGFLLATLILGAVTVAATANRTIEVTYGVNVVLDGVTQTFSEDMQPFVSGGRTFMPLRAIADALGLDVQWDSATSTAYLSSDAPAAPAPTPAPVATPGTVVFTGTGDNVVPVAPFPETYVFVISGNTEGRHFSVWADGSRRNLLVNTTSPYEGITFTTNQDTNMLEITATGDWRIEQRPLADMRTISTGQTITGSGDEVLRIASHGRTAYVEGNSENRHFSVWARGGRDNLLVNTTSEYSGRVALRDTYTVLEISAVGDWSVTFE